MQEQIGMAGLGMILGGINDQRQIDQQRELQGMQIKGNKEMADYSQQKQKEMWDYTNYENQKKHMKNAGLNPALMYGMGGGGGSSLGSGASGSVNGGDAPKGGGEAMGMMQMALMDAQRRNIEADTANKNAGTPGIVSDGVIKGINAKVEGAIQNNRITQSNNEADKSGWDRQIRETEFNQANAEWMALKQVLTEPAEEDKDPLVKSIRAGLAQKISQLDNLKEDLNNKRKEGTLKEDEHDLNEIEKEIQGFTADLSELGINGTTMGLITTILGKLMGIRIKRADKGTTTERVSYDKKGRETSTTTRTMPNKKQ